MNSNMRIALYPGSFDPITLGHVDIARRAAHLFDKVIVGIYASGERASKKPLFELNERVEFARSTLSGIETIAVDTFDELLVDYARRVGARAIVRGLRAVSDFEYEFQLAHMYQHLDPQLEIVCLMTSSDQSFISSSIIKEVASLGGSVDDLVPPVVNAALERHFRIAKV